MHVIRDLDCLNRVLLEAQERIPNARLLLEKMRAKAETRPSKDVAFGNNPIKAWFLSIFEESIANSRELAYMSIFSQTEEEKLRLAKKSAERGDALGMVLLGEILEPTCESQALDLYQR
jgi:hypothetical protein